MARERNRIFIDEAIKEVAKAGIVLDVGGGERFTKWMKEYEPLFRGVDYRTMDYDATTNADVVGDIHAIPLTDNSIDAVICSSVLEHVKDPHIAMKEITRILKPGGILLLTVPSTYPYHARKGHYPDYWRFFEDTVRDLLSGYSTVRLKKRGGYFLALTFFVPGQARMRGFLTPLADVLDSAFNTEARNTTAGIYALATK